MFDAEVAEIDQFLADYKVLDGYMPVWKLAYGRDWQSRWAIRDSLDIQRGELCMSIDAALQKPSIVATCERRMIFRIDLVPADECEPNHITARALGLPSRVCGSHIHPWPANREFVRVNGFRDLPLKQPVEAADIGDYALCKRVLNRTKIALAMRYFSAGSIPDVQTADGGRIETSQPFPTNVGGAGGQRVVTTSFHVGLIQQRFRYAGRVLLAADLPRDEFQDEFAMRRRAAHACVTIGKDVARMILAGTYEFEVERRATAKLMPPSPWCRLAFTSVKTYDEYERRATGYLEFKSEPAEDDPTINPAHVKLIGERLKWLAESLHGAIDLEVNRPVFGKG